MTSALSGRACGIVVLLALSATPASPCSMIGPSPTPAQLVEMATVIVRVRAEGLAAHAAAAEQFGTSQRISFAILAVLKGSLPSTAIEVSGTLEDRDDPNDRPVPYDFVRPDGRAGSCYATAYRQGAEYLLLLQESPKGGPGPAG